MGVQAPDSELVVANTLSEAGLRYFYDPTERFNHLSIGEVVDWAASTRAEVNAPIVGALAAHEVVLAEATHAMLDQAEGVPLPIPAERQRSIAHATEQHAGRVALAVSEVANIFVEAREQRKRELPKSFTVAKLPPKSVLMGKVMASVAHDGRIRRSGGMYYRHPDQVSSILTIAWDRHVPATPENNRKLDIVRLVAYGDDGYEDTIDERDVKEKGQYLNERAIITPLVAKLALRHLHTEDGKPEFTEVEARDIAMNLLYTSRLRDGGGNRQRYLEYIKRGVARGGAVFALDKAASIYRNLTIDPDEIDPHDTKSQEKIEKRQMYVEAKQYLEDNADDLDYDGTPLMFLLPAIFRVTRGEIARYEGQKFQFDTGLFALMAREHIDAQYVTAQRNS